MSGSRYTYPFFAPPDRPAGPYLPIRLVNPFDKASFVWHCLVDTGADSCLFTAALASLTRHNLTGDGVKSDATVGIEGKRLRTYKHTFALELLHPKDPDKVVWRSRRGLFECLGHDEFPPLLGVADFLRHFRVILDCTIRWLRALKTGGVVGLLRRAHGGGAPPQVKGQVLEQFREGLRQGRWKRAKEIQRWLTQEHGVRMGETGVRYWLGKLGGVLKVPRKTHAKKDAAQADGFQRTLAEKLKNLNVVGHVRDA